MRTRFKSARVFVGLAVALAVARPHLAHAQQPDETKPADPESSRMDEYREQLREAAADYHAGRYAEAIVKYQKVIGQVGTRTGYRIAFNLGRAFEAHGEPRQAAEHYQTYLDEVARRRAGGETIEPRVLEQETEANARIGELAHRLGRIHVLADAQSTTIARIDQSAPRVAEFVVYVDPGKHTVTFGTDAKAPQVDVDVGAGDSLDIPPPPPVPVEAPPAVRYVPRTERPFPSTVLFIAGGVALVSVVVPIVTYANALSTKSDYDGAVSAGDGARALQLRSDYDSAKGTAYASVAVPALFAAGAVALGAWYVLGTKDVLVPVPVVTKDGAGAAFQRRF